MYVCMCRKVHESQIDTAHARTGASFGAYRTANVQFATPCEQRQNHCSPTVRICNCKNIAISGRIASATLLQLEFFQFRCSRFAVARAIIIKKKKSRDESTCVNAWIAQRRHAEISHPIIASLKFDRENEKKFTVPFGRITFQVFRRRENTIKSGAKFVRARVKW